MPDQIEQRVLDDIAKFGWHMIGVQPGETDPRFTYTIGMMQTLDHPELVIVGLEDKTAATILNLIGAEIRGGRPFREPGLYEGIVKGFACKTRSVPVSSHPAYLGYAMWHRRHVNKTGTLEAVQILWPDKAGLFPDEAGCDANIVGLQGLL